jgi:hypothetical protein
MLLVYAGHDSLVVYGMNCLRSLERCGRGFESQFRHGWLVCVCLFLCLCCPVFW